MNHPFLPPGSKILVGMSGGVDSSVSAALLKEQGYEVVGGFIKNWSDTKDLWTGECSWRAERRDAMRVAARLGISLLTFDFEERYRERVLDRMFAEYATGRTPNPDVLCNEEIKFGLFFEQARALGFDGVATGHYAQIRVDEDGCHLVRAVDTQKDQTYFLHRMSREALSRTLFPIGHLTKPDVRTLAEKFGLPTATKPDSQGICFVGKINFRDFLRKKIPATPGDIVTETGEIVGHHDGLDMATIGQRQGVTQNKDGKTWYVAKKNEEKNQLIVVPSHDHPLLFSDCARLVDSHWLESAVEACLKSGERLSVDVMTRYRQPPVPAELVMESGAVMVRFMEPAWAIAPGQSAVLYQGPICLGGGFFGK